ncbi:class I SAM-dependent methyltransferase [Bryocella elongata]|uniref:class I SAM-dependent methyltransferase n=1 Tax=Bryocella elongata TaxID=863522 RepID=UPI00190E892B|nr:class I SAM-dependent methyltransferase [Bryocella elongata]
MKQPASTPVMHPFDRKFGTDTSGLLTGQVIARGTGAVVEELTAYYGIAPSILHTLLDIWLTRTEPENEIEHTVFLDVGAGKGRAMLVASQYPFLRVEGIELSPRLARVAEANIAKFEQHPENDELSPLKLVQDDATKHPLPVGASLAFLFHPFELPMLKRFVAHVERTLAEHPHPFDLIYANTEHDAWLDKHPSFERVWFGNVPMSPEDHKADMAEIAQQKEYGSTGDELCAIYRFVGQPETPKAAPLKKTAARKPAAAKKTAAGTKKAAAKKAVARKAPAKKAAARKSPAKLASRRAKS